ncbi:hypothetical protein CI610_03267 [invertebrate metagenome]|uniref:Uncharacterized protein n=1 Tax=invertebrate metagenome TaxID=1711999 RepID=A0A2H9T3J7_9ZZZZ
MKFINRCMVCVKPLEPMVKWVNEQGEVCPENWLLEGAAYLLDEQEDEEALVASLQKVAPQIFDNELISWTEDQKKWPAHRSYSLLREWFDLHISVVCFDLGTTAMLRADMDTAK